MGVIKTTVDAISAMVGRVIDPRNVLDPNGKTKRSFSGLVVGHFRRTGPNSWDAYEFVAEEGGPIDVFPGVRIHVESSDALFRMRAKGKVMMVQWSPSEQERAKLNEDQDMHSTFIEAYVERFKNKAGMGVAAAIAKSLRR